MSVPTSRPPFQPTYPGVVVPAPAAKPTQRNLLRLAQVVRRRAVVIAGTTLTAAVAALALSALQDPIYRGEFRLLVTDSDAVSLDDTLPDEVASQLPSESYDTQVEVLKSQALLSPIAQELQEQYPDIDSRSLAADLSIERLKGTRILAVEYRSDSFTLTQTVLEEVSEQFLAYSAAQRQTGLQRGIAFVDGQLPELRDRVDTLQERLEQFRRQYNLFDPTTRSGDLSELLRSVEQQRQALQTELVQARSLFQSLQSQLDTTPAEAIASTTLSESSRYQSLLDQIKALEAQIAVESARYLADSPQIAALEDRRSNLLDLLETEADLLLRDQLSTSADSSLTPTTIALSRQLIDVANNIETLQARSQSLAQVEQDLAQEFNLVPAIAREYADLQRELEAATQSLNRFVETRETLKIDAAQTSAPWELISAPQTESKPVAYHLLRNAGLGALLGLLLGLVAAAVMEKLDQVFHSTEDLKSMAPPPVVGTIPYVRDLHKRGLVGATSADSPSLEYMLLLEAFRSLYTSIRFLDSDASVGSMVVTSTIPGEGKSTIAAGLAQAAAAVGQRVLLVDADLRTPQQHLRADLSNHQGLTNLTSEAADPSTVVQRTADPNLFVLTAGPRPADAGRVLASQQMQAVMQQLHQAFDVVIYDTPPASGFADSSLLAARVDRLILTVGLGKTDRALVERCLEKLRFSSTTAMVMVANGIKPYTTPMQRYAGYQHYYQPSEPSAPPPEDAGSTPSLSSRPISPTARDSASTPEADPGLPARSSAPNSGPARPSAATASSAPPALKSAAVLRRYQLGWKPTAVMIGGMLLLGAGSFLAIAWLTQRQGEPDVTAASDRPDAPSESNAETADADTAASGDAAIADEPAPFERAVQIAEAAVTTGGSAQTPPEWSQTAELWQQASALMAMVPETDARFEVARDRVIEYRSNSEYARQRALFLQLEAR